MKRPLIILSKPGDRHGNPIEGDFARAREGRVVIVDDFIGCGDTLTKLMAMLPSQLQLTGLVLYAHPWNARERERGKLYTNNCYTVRRIGASDSRRFSIEGRSIWQPQAPTSKPARRTASAGTTGASPLSSFLGQGTVDSGRRLSPPPPPAAAS